MKLFFILTFLFLRVAFSQVEFNQKACEKNNSECYKKEMGRVNSANSALFKEKLKKCESFSFNVYMLNTPVKKISISKTSQSCKMSTEASPEGIIQTCQLEEKDLALMLKGETASPVEKQAGVIRTNSICKTEMNKKNPQYKEFIVDQKKQEDESKPQMIQMLIEDFEGTVEACKDLKIPIACMALEKGKQYQLADCKSDKTKPLCKLKF